MHQKDGKITYLSINIKLGKNYVKVNSRRSERRWRKSRLVVDRQMFVAERSKLKTLIDKTKTQYFSDKVSEATGGSRTLFTTINNLLCNSESRTWLPSVSPKELADRFSPFFHDKIKDIRLVWENSVPYIKANEEICDYVSFNNVPVLAALDKTTTAEVTGIVSGMPSKSCALDPFPTWLLKNMLQHIAPVLVNVINASIATGSVPELMKVAHVRPLLKKPSLEIELLKHYRPVSNLSFLLKVLDKVVAERLTQHLQDNNLHKVMQSAYRPRHSTESVILRVTNDILRAVDRQSMTILVLLDISGASDTINHERLLHRMSTRLNVKDSALNWFRSYLYLRSQVVAIEANISDSRNQDYGVPQSSVLGPLLFSIYMLRLGDLLRKLGVSFHQYADNTQMYMSCMPKEVKVWMCSNMLKLNLDKTEFLLVGSPHNISRISAPILNLEGSVIAPSAKVRNLGVILNSTFTMDKHISAVCQVANYHLRNIGMIRKYLTQKAAEQAVHALITSRLDYCNSSCMVFLQFSWIDYSGSRIMQHVSSLKRRDVIT